MIPFQIPKKFFNRTDYDPDGKLWAWYDFTDVKTAASYTSDKIMTIFDKSGHNNHLRVPKYLSASMVWSANGVTSPGSTMTNYLVNYTNTLMFPITIYTIVTCNNFSGQWYIYSDDSVYFVLQYKNATNQLMISTGDVLTDTVVDKPVIVTARFTDSVGINDCRVNDDIVKTLSVGYNYLMKRPRAFIIGQQKMTIAGMVVRNNYDDDWTRLGIIKLLANKYDPTGSLGMHYFRMDSSELISDSWSMDENKLPH